MNYSILNFLPGDTWFRQFVLQDMLGYPLATGWRIEAKITDLDGRAIYSVARSGQGASWAAPGVMLVTFSQQTTLGWTKHKQLRLKLSLTAPTSAFDSSGIKETILDTVILEAPIKGEPMTCNTNIGGTPATLSLQLPVLGSNQPCGGGSVNPSAPSECKHAGGNGFASFKNGDRYTDANATEYIPPMAVVSVAVGGIRVKQAGDVAIGIAIDGGSSGSLVRVLLLGRIIGNTRTGTAGWNFVAGSPVYIQSNGTVGDTVTGDFFGVALASSIVLAKPDGGQAAAPATELVVPEGVTEILAGAFQNWTNISKATLPASVVSIGEFAFAGCTALTTVTLAAETPPTLGAANAFDNHALIYVPATAVADYRAAPVWDTLASRIMTI